jgi:predicted TPR repeat methyltransferase
MKDKNKSAVELYDEVAEAYAKNFDSVTTGEAMIFLDTFLAQFKPRSEILDLGCGSGFSANYFREHNMKVEGVDLSKAMINIARRNYPNIEFHIDDVRTFRPKNILDGVWAGYSLFHFGQNDFVKTLEQVKTYLKPGGVLGVVVQEGQGEQEVPEPLAPGKSMYIHLYDEELLSQLLTAANFEVIEVKRKKPLLDNELPFNKLLVIAKLNE